MKIFLYRSRNINLMLNWVILSYSSWQLRYFQEFEAILNINIKQMSWQQTQIPCLSLSSEYWDYILQQERQAACICRLENITRDGQSQDHRSNLVKLELRKQTVLIFDQNTNTRLGGFQCQYEVNFKAIYNKTEGQSKVGKINGLDIILLRPQNLQKNSQQNSQRLLKWTLEFKILENHIDVSKDFVRILSSKYIVQQGFHDLFKAVRLLGKGGTAQVYQAYSMKDDSYVAVKAFRRSHYFGPSNPNGKESFKKEFQIFSSLGHPNLCKFYGVYESENTTYIVMEKLQYSLLGYLKENGYPSKSIIKKIIKDCLKGLIFMHANGIMHRDLKLDNIMVNTQNKIISDVRIIDFGLAQEINAERYLYTRCGTPGFVAPEILALSREAVDSHYSQKCDIFSLGSIFHTLLLQRSLFDGTDAQKMIKLNAECALNFEDPKYNAIKPLEKDLLMRMLSKKPQERISASEALQHKCLQQEQETRNSIP